MESGQTAHYIQARKDRDFRSRVTYHSPIFERALAPTYGAVVYQEQPLQILRDYGMDIGSINVLFKILKDSGKGAVERNAVRLASLRALAEKLITDVDDFEDAWHQLTGFVAYGFNKAHATGYGIRSYRFAYLKAYYPLEFMTGLLTVAAGKAEDERKYAAEARRIGIRILSPDVNISGVGWTIDRKRNGIRKGLLSIKGVGEACAASIVANRPYQSIADLAARTDARAVSGAKLYLSEGRLTGRLLDLDNADAFDSIKSD
jgi:DNA polymerase-3 subunit alpha